MEKQQFKVINRTTREEQIFNSNEILRFFKCEYDHQTKKIKYNNKIQDYAISEIKSDEEKFMDNIIISLIALCIIVLTTKLIMSWI